MRLLTQYQQSRLDDAFRRSWRVDALTAQGNKCRYCDEPLTAKSATADHVQALHVFGLDSRNNIVAACRSCNAVKGHKLERAFRKSIENPARGSSLHVWLAWSRRRINRRLALMEKRLGITV